MADVAPRLLSIIVALGSLANLGALAQIATATPSELTSDIAKPIPADPGRTPSKDATSTVTLKAVVIRGTDETEARRQSTAAKIIVGRDDIELYGDSTVGELLKRLPGITVQGRPGRGGAPRMRGLGNGYTQILIDGERVPRGFSLDDLSPEQIERIEILRAPTAETGAG